jgi:hypothetical protein
VTGQTPFTAKVKATNAGFLETPHMFIEGYSARVNGRATPVRRSPHGFAMIPVPAGKSDVVLRYPGPLSLRIAWFVSLACFAVWPSLVLAAANSSRAPRIAHFAAQAKRPLLVAVAAALGITATVWVVNHLHTIHEAYGSLRLQVKLPARPVNSKEPLLTIGRPGAADCVFVVYERDGQVRFGFDHWGFGGPLSDAIAVDLTQPHTMEITLGGLYPTSRLFGRAPLPKQYAKLRVTLDGKPVLDQEQPFHPASAQQVYLGRNPVGTAGVSPQFSGLILSAERFVSHRE